MWAREHSRLRAETGLRSVSSRQGSRNIRDTREHTDLGTVIPVRLSDNRLLETTRYRVQVISSSITWRKDTQGHYFMCFFLSLEIEGISIHLFVKNILNNAKIIHRSQAFQYGVSKLTFLLKIQNNYVSSLVSNAIQFDSIFSLKQTDNDPRYSKVALQPEMCFSSAPHSWTLELQTVFTFIPQSVNLPGSHS